jgi:ABC-type Na+ transport system ATPase subunit NatA
MKQVRKTRRQVFFTKLTMQNIKEFCFVSIVKRGHLLLPNFLPMFLMNFQKKQKIAKNIENPKKCFFDIFASFLAFSASSQKNLIFKGLSNAFDF